jgi:hypothetical protein
MASQAEKMPSSAVPIKHALYILLCERSVIHVYYMNLLIDPALNREINTSPGADVKASKVTRTHSRFLRVAVLPDTAAREKAVMTRLMLGSLSGLISAFAAILTTVVYSTVLEWRYFWLAVCVAGFIGLVVFLWKACEQF